MATTIDFLDAVKARKHVVSDYALAPVLGITRAQVSRLRNGKDYFGDSTAIQVARLLEIEPGYVAACAHAERAKSEDEKALWTSVLRRFADNDALFHTPNCGADALRTAAD